MAYEVLERNRGAHSLEVVGIRRRGAALARLLAGELERVEGVELVVHELDVAPYRDDRPSGSPPPDTSTVHTDLTGRDVILVDDVLFTGRTARAALDAVVRYGRPQTIQLAVLVDRGHREYPLQPDYVGLALPTKHQERVVVDVEAGYTIYIEE